MKKYLLLLLATASIIACNKVGKDEFIIEGDATGIANGVSVYLQKQDSTGLVQVDTVKVENGKFKFEGKVTAPGIHFVAVDKIEGKAVIILENGEIALKIRKDSIGKSTVAGTFSNEQLTIYAKESQKINKRMMAFQNANMAKFNEAQTKKDTVAINALMKENSVYQKEFEKLSMDHMEKNPKSYLSLLFLEQFLNQPTADMVKLKKIFDNLDASLKTTKEAKRIKKAFALKNDSKIGSVAPNFFAPNPTGKQVSLTASLGKYTIIDFWASWCGPCRAENPAMVKLYHDFHQKGLNIIGVSLDKTRAAWTAAIAKDGLIWEQVSNLKEWQDPIALQYKIESIPATYILDKNGVIIAKDLHGDALRSKMEALFLL